MVEVRMTAPLTPAPLTPAQLAEWRAACEGAEKAEAAIARTERAYQNDDVHGWQVDVVRGQAQHAINARNSLARTALPALLAEVERGREELAEVRRQRDAFMESAADARAVLGLVEGEGVAQAAARVVAERDALRLALENCHALAARESARKAPPDASQWATVWKHIGRFCRDAGVVGSVLRGEDEGSASTLMCRHPGCPWAVVSEGCCDACYGYQRSGRVCEVCVARISRPAAVVVPGKETT